MGRKSEDGRSAVAPRARLDGQFLVRFHHLEESPNLRFERTLLKGDRTVFRDLARNLDRAIVWKFWDGPLIPDVHDLNVAFVGGERLDQSVAVAIELLRPGGALLVKSFVSNDLQIFTAELKQYFATVQRTKPEATRQGSSEFYFYAKGFSARPNTTPSL